MLRVLTQVVVNLILCGIIAGLATALSGALILPTVAGDELRQSISMALIGVGKSLSGYTELICANTLSSLAVITRPSLACKDRCMVIQLYLTASLQRMCLPSPEDAVSPECVRP